MHQKQQFYIKQVNTCCNKHYELTNLPIAIEMGNVLVVITDQKHATCQADTVTHYTAQVTSGTDYSPFGAPLAGRTWYGYASGGYRFGFNGMEKIDEVSGVGNFIDYGARVRDPRVGPWLSTDPLQAKYPHLSPYNFVSNCPISMVDPDGRDNIIYLVNLPSKDNKLTNGDAYKIAEQATKNFASLGLITIVVVVDKEITGGTNFDPNKIDATDRIAVIGTKTDVKSFIKTTNETFANNLEENWVGGINHPERSENINHKGGKFIAIDGGGVEGFGAKVGNLDKIQTGALIINHGAGHTATLDEAYSKNKGESGYTVSPVMSSAESMQNRLSPKGGQTLTDILDMGKNKDYSDALRNPKTGMGNNDPKINYPKKK